MTGNELQSDTRSRTPQRRVWPAVLLMAALGAGAAVWLARPKAGGGPAVIDEGLYSGAAAGGLDAHGLVPAGEVPGPRMEALAALPGDLVMPPGAEKRSLICRTLLGQVEIKAEYEDSGSVSESSEWMAAELRRLGWRETSGGKEAAEGVFCKSGDTLYLCLKPTRGRVNILAVIRRAIAQRPPAPQGE